MLITEVRINDHFGPKGALILNGQSMGLTICYYVAFVWRENLVI